MIHIYMNFFLKYIADGKLVSSSFVLSAVPTLPAIAYVGFVAPFSLYDFMLSCSGRALLTLLT